MTRHVMCATGLATVLGLLTSIASVQAQQPMGTPPTNTGTGSVGGVSGGTTGTGKIGGGIPITEWGKSGKNSGATLGGTGGTSGGSGRGFGRRHATLTPDQELAVLMDTLATVDAILNSGQIEANSELEILFLLVLVFEMKREEAIQAAITGGMGGNGGTTGGIGGTGGVGGSGITFPPLGGGTGGTGTGAGTGGTSTGGTSKPGG